MKKLFILSLLSLLLSGCAQCVQSHDEKGINYMTTCVYRDKRGTCRVYTYIPYEYTYTVCDKWINKP